MSVFGQRSCINIEYSKRWRCSRTMAERSPQDKPSRLEDPDTLRLRRDQVLERYKGFKEAAKQRRGKLEDARKFQQFRRDADELESWIREKMQVVSDDSYSKDGTNLQVSCACYIGRPAS